MALNVFLAEKVDVAIIEVGIGGEFDCTNVFTKTDVVGISSLGYDHTSLLGNTIEEIAWQKGGIMKPGALAFTSSQPAVALRVLHQRALERRCCLWEVPPLNSYSWQGHVAVGLTGQVQTLNASLALQLSQAWISRNRLGKSSSGFLGYANAFHINQTTAEGLKQCSWPGRYQILTRNYINGTCKYYLDGAHTLESIELCVQWFLQTTRNIVSRDLYQYSLVFNVTGDRDTAELLAPLVTCHFNRVFFCPNILAPDSRSSDQTNYMVTSKQQCERCESNKEIWLHLERCSSIFATEVKTFPSVTETLKHIEHTIGEQHVLVTGSLHLIGAMIKVLDPDLSSFSPPLKL